MNVRNHTPFVPSVYEHFAVSGAAFLPFILKGTFNLAGGQLRLSKTPIGLNTCDEFYGEANISSVRQESDYIPFKPHTDVYFVDPVAHAPKANPTGKWQVSVSIGDLTKSIQVFGPRRWVKGLWGWSLSEPQKCRFVPIRYELAYGGSDKSKAYEHNPIGRGFLAPTSSEEFAAHQFEDVNDPISSIGLDHKPIGLGPITRSWQPRRSLAGTYDDKWLDEKWPVMPDDFDFKYFNCASSDLILNDYLLGGEKVSCTGLSKSGNVEFRLPNNTVFILARCHDGAIIPWRCNLDTVAINLEKNVCFLTWRAQLPKLPYRVLEARVFENN